MTYCNAFRNEGYEFLPPRCCKMLGHKGEPHKHSIGFGTGTYPADEWWDEECE